LVARESVKALFEDTEEINAGFVVKEAMKVALRAKADAKAPFVGAVDWVRVDTVSDRLVTLVFTPLTALERLVPSVLILEIRALETPVV